MSEEIQGTAEVYTFAKPVRYEGEEFKEITLDFEQLTGEDILTCDRQFRAENGRQSGEMVKETNKAYQAYVVAKAAGVHVGLIRALSAKDFTRLTLQAQSFLLL
ncbi:phage tail assembly protein [Paenibacillus piscarius]|uniref:phage tail assembly protein n=1 Tax=Paenibacillus piscarius TaxID=1089681 RepID=UPI001EE9103B|nr:phage tail assembly protein [Paenibacillus piscarius]